MPQDPQAAVDRAFQRILTACPEEQLAWFIDEYVPLRDDAARRGDGFWVKQHDRRIRMVRIEMDARVNGGRLPWDEADADLGVQLSF